MFFGVDSNSEVVNGGKFISHQATLGWANSNPDKDGSASRGLPFGLPYPDSPLPVIPLPVVVLLLVLLFLVVPLFLVIHLLVVLLSLQTSRTIFALPR